MRVSRLTSAIRHLTPDTSMSDARSIHADGSRTSSPPAARHARRQRRDPAGGRHRAAHVGFGRGVLFCRWLSPEELGHWDMAYSFLLLAAPLVVLGLPGSFGRYLERYRQRGQLRTFLRRATIWTARWSIVAVATMIVAAPRVLRSDLRPRRPASLTLLLAVSLVAVILHHFLEALFAALRKFRIVSTMHFCQSMVVRRRFRSGCCGAGERPARASSSATAWPA